MTKSRLEAFSDGVFAIAITLLVIDLRHPSSGPVNALPMPCGSNGPATSPT